MPDYSRFRGARQKVQAQVTSLARSGALEESISRLERWLAGHPYDRESWFWLGDLRQRMGAHEAAEAAWERVAAAPDALGRDALLRIAGARLRGGDPRRARKSFQRALACGPPTADAHCGLAAAAGQLGDFESLRREAAEALALNSCCYMAWYQLTLVPDIDITHIEGMQRAAREAGDDPKAWLLHLAIGRVRERSRDYGAAFAAYSEGQRRRAQVFSIDFASQERYFESLRRQMNKSFLGRRLTTETVGFRPIFIVGMPRSGTTLVEAIIGAHPDVGAGGEMRFVYDWINRSAGSIGTESAVNWLVSANDSTLARLAMEWHGALCEKRGPRARVTDKFPLNFTLVGLLALCFPDACVVHVRRDPRDTCVSCYTTAFEGNAIPASLGDLGAYYRGYESLMSHWRELLGVERIIDIQYEALVENPESEARELLAAVDLSWHQQCLSFYKMQRTVATASLYQVRQPIYSNSVGRWQHFKPWLAPLFEGLASDQRA